MADSVGSASLGHHAPRLTLTPNRTHAHKNSPQPQGRHAHDRHARLRRRQRLDVTGPIEAFSNANDLARELGHATVPYELVLIGLRRSPFRTESGLLFRPHVTLRDAPPLDTLIVPGGRGLREPATNAKVSAWVARHADRTRRNRDRPARASMASRRRACSTAAASRRTGASPMRSALAFLRCMSTAMPCSSATDPSTRRAASRPASISRSR